MDNVAPNIYIDVLNFLMDPQGAVELPPILADEFTSQLNEMDFQNIEIKHLSPAEILEIMFLENIILNIYMSSANEGQIKLIEDTWLVYFATTFKDSDINPRQMLSGWISDAVVRDYVLENNLPPDHIIDGLVTTNEFISQLIASGNYVDTDIIDNINSALTEHFQTLSANSSLMDDEDISEKTHETLDDIYDDCQILTRCIWQCFPEIFECQMQTPIGVQVFGELLVELHSIGEIDIPPQYLELHPLALIRNQLYEARNMINNFL